MKNKLYIYICIFIFQFIYIYKNTFVFYRWSNKRPGVAIITFTPLYNLIASYFLFAPPINKPRVLLWKWFSSTDTSNVYYASSRVGDSIIIAVPFIYVNYALYINSNAGIKKPKVLPDPVFAAPKTSLPFNKWGIDLAWIWVILINFILLIASWVFSQIGSSENVLSDKRDDEFLLYYTISSTSSLFYFDRRCVFNSEIFIS